MFAQPNDVNVKIQEVGHFLNYSLAQVSASQQALSGKPLTLQEKRILLIRAVQTYHLSKTAEESEHTHPFNSAHIIHHEGLPNIAWEDESNPWDNNIVVQHIEYARAILTPDVLLAIQVESLNTAEQQVNELLNIENLIEEEKNYFKAKRKMIRNQYLAADRKRFLEEMRRPGLRSRDKSYFIRQYIEGAEELIRDWFEDLLPENQIISLQGLNLSQTNLAKLDLSQVILTGCELARADLTETLIESQQLMNCHGFSTIRGVNQSLIEETQIRKMKQLLDTINDINDNLKFFLDCLPVIDSFDHYICWGAPPNLQKIPDEIFSLSAYLALTQSDINQLHDERDPISYPAIAKLSYKEFAAESRELIEKKVKAVLASYYYRLAKEDIVWAKSSRLSSLAKEWQDCLPQSVHDVKRWLPELTEAQCKEIEYQLDTFNRYRIALKRLEVDCRIRYDREYMTALLDNLHGDLYPTSCDANKRLMRALLTAQSNPNMVVDLSERDLKEIEFSKLDLCGLRFRMSQEQVERYLTKKQRQQRNEQLRAAVKKGEILLVRQLLKEGVEPDLPGVRGSTALKLACMDNHFTLVKLLIKYHAKVEHPTQGFTIFQAACRLKGIDLRIVELLIKHGATMDLASAIAVGDKKRALPLLQNIKDINQPTPQGEYVLHLAVQQEMYEMIDWLIEECKANVNQKNERQLTALLVACEKGLKVMAELLLQHKADKEAVDRRGRNALRIAVDANHLDLAYFLFTQGVSLDWFSAIHLGMIDSAVQKLGGRVKERDKASGYPPLHVAVLANQPTLIENLIDRKANTEQTDDQSYTALGLACRKAKLEMVQCLCDNGAAVNDYSPSMTPPLFAALQGLNEQLSNVDKRLTEHERAQIIANCIAIINLLLSRGVDLEIKRNDCTALHLAASFGVTEVVTQLLAAGADFSARDAGGNMPLHLAIQAGHLTVAEILLSAYVHVKNVKELDAVELARQNGDESLISLISRYAMPLVASTENKSSLPSQKIADFFQSRRAAMGLSLFSSSAQTKEPDKLVSHVMHFVNGRD